MKFFSAESIDGVFESDGRSFNEKALGTNDNVGKADGTVDGTADGDRVKATVLSMPTRKLDCMGGDKENIDTFQIAVP